MTQSFFQLKSEKSSKPSSTNISVTGILIMGWVVFGLLAWLILSIRRRRVKKEAAPETAEVAPLEELRAYIDRRIAEGFDPPAIIAESAAEYLELKGQDRLIAAMVKEGMARYFLAQREWPATTDCDRLDRCFADLEKDGIVARQNFTCCQTCGHAEIGEQIEEARKRGAVAGYTFYHQQDTEAAAEGGGIYLAYGALSGEESKAVDVANRIVDALGRAELKVTWDGKTSTRIHVHLDWKRRL